MTGSLWCRRRDMSREGAALAESERTCGFSGQRVIHRHLVIMDDAEELIGYNSRGGVREVRATRKAFLAFSC